MGAISRVLIEHYRCPDGFLNLKLTDRLSDDTGFFQFGPEVICYGRSSVGHRRSRVETDLYDLIQDVILHCSEVCLPLIPLKLSITFAWSVTLGQKTPGFAIVRERPIISCGPFSTVRYGSKFRESSWHGRRGWPFPTGQ
jgi:hypothetical protein